MCCEKCAGSVESDVDAVTPEKGPVPYLIHEASQERNARTVRWLIVALLFSVIMIVVSNLAWLYCWNQYDYASEESTIEVDAKDGIANYIGNNGDITNGTDQGG